MNIFTREFKELLDKILLWFLLGVLLLAGFSALYVYAGGGHIPLSSYLEKAPAFVSKLFDLDPDAAGYFPDFYRKAAFPFAVALPGLIWAVILGAKIYSKELKNKTLELLLLRPINTPSLITHKLAAGILAFLICDTGLLLVSCANFCMIGGADGASLLQYMLVPSAILHLNLFLAQLLLFSICLSATVICSRGFAGALTGILFLAGFGGLYYVGTTGIPPELLQFSVFYYLLRPFDISAVALVPVYIAAAAVLSVVIVTIAKIAFTYKKFNFK